jgi:NADPH-dependent curcumin reductase CurA
VLHFRGALPFARAKYMSSSNTVNHRIVLASRPVVAPTAKNFHLQEDVIPVASGVQVLIRSRFLSLDPYMLRRMSESPTYAAAIALGEVMVGGNVARVEPSQRSECQPGDIALAYSGWQDYALSEGTDLTKVASASGGVGLVVSQSAKLKGCHVVGIAGGAEKCRFVVAELGFAACIDRHGGEIAQRLAEA